MWWGPWGAIATKAHSGQFCGPQFCLQFQVASPSIRVHASGPQPLFPALARRPPPQDTAASNPVLVPRQDLVEVAAGAASPTFPGPAGHAAATGLTSGETVLAVCCRLHACTLQGPLLHLHQHSSAPCLLRHSSLVLAIRIVLIASPTRILQLESGIRNFRTAARRHQRESF